MLQGVLLRIVQIAHQRARGANYGRKICNAEARKRIDLEMLDQCLLAAFKLKEALLFSVGIIMRLYPFGKVFPAVDLLVDYYLPRIDPDKLIHKVAGSAFADQLNGVEIACRNVAVGKHQYAVCGVDRADIIVGPVVEHLLFNDGAGGDDADNVAFDEPFCKRGILKLFAYGDLVPLFDKLVYVGVYGVIRHAAHGSAFGKAAVP